MIKTKLFVVSHNHTPFGSTDEEYEKAYISRYKPFIVSLYRYPEVQAVLHYSGVLLEWLERHHPEFLMTLVDLVNRKQVELLGGGFYEPMLPLIPQTDKIGQIELETTYLRKQFGKRPRGCWLPGYMWEQNLPGTLQACGMEYVFLTADQFRAAGLSGGEAERPCYTEDQGKLLTILPVSDHADLPLSLADTDSFIDSIEKPASDGGERFLAIFPELYLLRSTDEGACEAQLSLFFEKLSAAQHRIELSTPQKALKTFEVTQKAFFSSSAERRVMYWAMDEQRRRGIDELLAFERKGSLKSATSYFQGASPRQFLVRYPEANSLYSKMLYTHILINQLRGDKYRKKAAREELWKAQGCEAFWHVEQGGLYRNKLRKATYRALISAEKITREKGVFLPSVVSIDFDADRKLEYLLQGSDLNAYIHGDGGSVFELDHLGKAWNYLDTLARRKEGYLNGDCIQDPHRRSAFVDRLLPPTLTIREYTRAGSSYGRCTALEKYDEIEVDRVHNQLILRKDAADFGNYRSIEIVKKYQLKKNVLAVSYILWNRGTASEQFNFSPEIDLSFASDQESDQSIVQVCAGKEDSVHLGLSELRLLDELRIIDRENDISVMLSASVPFSLWLMPIYTRCRMDDSLVDIYQSTCLMPVLPVSLAPGESWPVSFTLRFAR